MNKLDPTGTYRRPVDTRGNGTDKKRWTSALDPTGQY